MLLHQDVFSTKACLLLIQSCRYHYLSLSLSGNQRPVMAPGNTSSSNASNALEVTVPCIVFFVLTSIFISIRIGGRIARVSRLGWDDYTILLSFVCKTYSIIGLVWNLTRSSQGMHSGRSGLIPARCQAWVWPSHPHHFP